jgi:hypothetical protein
MLDIFNSDAFSVMRMTEAMREVAYVPGRISEMGLFQVENIDTLDVAIEKQSAESLLLIPSSPRGAPGDTRDFAKRSMRKLSVPHFARMDAMYADEVMSVRAFASEDAVETLQSKIAMKAAVHSQDFALTEEFHRLSVIKSGILYDSDGTTPLYNYATEFGESLPAEVDFDLDNATPAAGALRKKCATLTRAMADSLGGLPFRGIMVIMGKNFADDFYAHKEVRETYLNYSAAADLRAGYVSTTGKTYGGFEFGGIVWEEYRGGGSVAVADDKAHAFPIGVPGLFKTLYAPADYIETVNRPGQRLYAKQWRMPNDKGVQMEFQMNALHYCTRPRVLMPLRRT